MSDDGWRLEADAGPCDVIAAVFVFGSTRCGEPALYSVDQDGGRWRVCDSHRFSIFGVGGQQ